MEKKDKAVKIERNVPLPVRLGKAHNRKYPWVELKVGESFLVVGVDGYNLVGQRNQFEKHIKSGKHFISRKVPEGFRVWRDK